MEVKGVLLKLSDVTFALIEVPLDILSDKTKAINYIKKHSFFFPGVPIVLMSYNQDKTPIYYGKKEITHLLGEVTPTKIPWKKYAIKKGK